MDSNHYLYCSCNYVEFVDHNILYCCRYKSAQLAQLASMELFQCLYFASMKAHLDDGAGVNTGGRDKLEGVVVGIRTNGVMVFIPR